MKNGRRIRFLTAGAVFGAILVLGIANNLRGQARGHSDDSERAQIGLAVAPVPLNLHGKDTSLIGLGSYLVNVANDCNGCHTANTTATYAQDRNPYLGQPKMINPATYLGGGRTFGSVAPNSPVIASRNLTPDKTGTTGGHTFTEFYQILTTGVDLDKAHPSCSATVTTNCLPAPFVGGVLQVMPWPSLQSLSINDIRAIYEYLSAIPCLEGGPGEPPNRCH